MVTSNKHFWDLFCSFVFLANALLIANSSVSSSDVPQPIFLNDYEFEKKIGDVSYAVTDCDLGIGGKPGIEWFKKAQNIKLNLNLEKYYRDIFRKLKSGPQVSKSTTQNWAKYKKATIKLASETCILDADYRLTGDLADHIGLHRGLLPHSVKVKIKKGSIGNITKFKLFLPETRGGRFELLNVLINQHLGFIAPRTALVDVEIGGKIYKALFQEDVGKELLENNNLHESIIIEGDEGSRPLINPRISNRKFLRNKYQETIAQNALHRIGKVYLETNISAFDAKRLGEFEIDRKDPPLAINFLNESNQSRFAMFHLLNMALKSSGGLTRDDHRMVFDFISREFHPIFYDGHYDRKKKIEFQPNFTFNDEQRNRLIDQLMRINETRLLSEVLQLGANFRLQEVRGVISDAIKFLSLVKSGHKLSEHRSNEEVERTIKEISRNIVNERKFRKINISWKLDDQNLKNCWIYLSKHECKTQLITEKNNRIGQTLSFQSLKSGIFVYGVNQNEDFTEYFHDIRKSRSKVGHGGTQIEYTENLEVKINFSTKTVKIKRKIKNSKTAQVRLFGGSLDNWTIDVDANAFLGYQQLPGNRISEYGLTGCITFNDIKLNALNLSIRDSNCEDAVHFVRVTGDVTSLLVDNAKNDGVDADFSNITFEKININSSGNDCFDLSSGKYNLKISKFKGCKDKGISAGEKATVKLSNLSVSQALIGVASKDGAFLEIEKAVVRDSEICFAAYQKKQEFEGGSIQINQAIYCEDAPSYVQNGSNILND